MQESLISYFNEYCENQLLLKGIARSVSHFVETGELGDKIYNCAFEADGWFCHIFMTESGFISHELSWDENDFEHDITEVFLLFDISDYNDYCYDNCIVESRVKNAVDETVSMLALYSRDIKRAGENDCYNKLLESSIVAEDVKGPSLHQILKNGRLHDKMVKTRSDKDREKYIAHLEKWEQKGWLSDIGKRDLKRLKAGFIDEEYDDSQDWIKEYNKRFFLSVAIITLISFAICFGVLLISKIVFLSGGVFVFGTFAIGCTVISSIILTVILSYLFSASITVRMIPDEYKEYQNEFKEKLNSEFHKTKAEKIIVRAFLVIAAVIGFPLLMSMATANYSFCEDYFISHYAFINSKVAYSDCTIYLVQGEYENDEYYEYQNSYYYIEYEKDGKKLVEDIGQVKNPEKQEQLKEIFDNNQIEIKTIKNIEE